MSGTNSTTSVIVAGARTPMGRLLGSLKTFSGADLGGFAIKAALDRAGIGGDQVQYVIMGQVLQAGAGQIPARQAAVKAGIPMNVPALTINKVCLSGLDAIAGGPADPRGRVRHRGRRWPGIDDERPHLLPKSREGFKYGAIEMLDAMAYDGLTDAFENIAMGESTEKHNTRLGILRPEQDEIAAASHQRAAAAQKNGVFEAEITPSRFRSARANRSFSARTRASGRRRRRSRWASCAPRSPRTARSRRARRRRSRTARRPWWS